MLIFIYFIPPPKIGENNQYVQQQIKYQQNIVNEIKTSNS